jgi:hypothetical protein
MVIETEWGAYLGPDADLQRTARQTAEDPHFDVFEGEEFRLILGKCSRLPDDEDPAAGRYGIDFHRGLPLFSKDSNITCDLGNGPVPVNALNYWKYLPRTLMFREFSANLAFAARTLGEYQKKAGVYRRFYEQVYTSKCQTVLAAPHSGDVRRPPDQCHPFPRSEIDAWTGRVMARIAARGVMPRRRILVSLHSTDYFGSFVDVGDFGLEQNRDLPSITAGMDKDFSKTTKRLLPGYYDYILPYTRSRLEWLVEAFGTIDPEQLGAVSTAARFEVLRLAKVVKLDAPTAAPLTLDALWASIEAHCAHHPEQLITLNNIFSGRKTAGLIRLDENLRQARFHTGVQIECSRFLGHRHPDVAAEIIVALIERLGA